MADSDKVFSGSIPEIYDSHSVRLIFEAYASDLAWRTAAGDPGAVLETAAGSGVVTRALAPMLGPQARYVVTDLNQPMLDHAAGRQTAEIVSPGNRQTRSICPSTTAPSMPFAVSSGSCSSPAGSPAMARPGGCFCFNVWDRIEENDFARLVTEAAAEVFPEDPPRFLARTPHGYHDAALIRDELAAAGFARVEVTTLEETSTAPTPRHPAVAYCQGTPLRNEIEARDPGLLAAVTAAAAKAIADHYGEGPVAGKIQGQVIAAEA